MDLSLFLLYNLMFRMNFCVQNVAFFGAKFVAYEVIR